MKRPLLIVAMLLAFVFTGVGVVGAKLVVDHMTRAVVLEGDAEDLL